MRPSHLHVCNPALLFIQLLSSRPLRPSSKLVQAQSRTTECTTSTRAALFCMTHMTPTTKRRRWESPASTTKHQRRAGQVRHVHTVADAQCPAPSRRSSTLLHSLVLLVLVCALLVPSPSAASRTPALFNAPPRRSGLLYDVLTSPGRSLSGVPAGDAGICRPTGQIEDACCDFEMVESINEDFFERLRSLVQTRYFRYYKVDLYKDCPFWVDNSLCMNKDCTVLKVDESEIPEQYRTAKLSSVVPREEVEEIPDHSTSSCSCREADFCHWDDTDEEAVYVDLLANPERFTGYAGPSANKVWRSIYEENCFTAAPKGSYLEPARAANSGGGTGFAALHAGKAGDASSAATSAFFKNSNLNTLLGSLEGPADPASSEQCLEKRVFYRIISGLHASISIHICADYLDQTTGEWGPNLECFISRIAQHPERLQNVYFNYVMILRALARAAEYEVPFNLRSGDAVDDPRTAESLQSLIGKARDCPPTFDEHTLFSGPDASELKDEFRTRFRNVSAIMDCVGCDKCRLWGKLQVNGLATALKILFSSGDGKENPVQLQRAELVALINTAHRFAESLRAVDTFRGLYQKSIKEAETGEPTSPDAGAPLKLADKEAVQSAANPPIPPPKNPASAPSVPLSPTARFIPTETPDPRSNTSLFEPLRLALRACGPSLLLCAREAVQQVLDVLEGSVRASGLGAKKGDDVTRREEL